MSEYETRPGYLSEFVSDEQPTSDAQPDDDSTDTRDCPCPDSWPVYEVTGDHIPEDFREMGDIEMWVLWNGQVKVPLAPWMTANLKATPWGSDVTYDYPETTLDQVERAAEESIVSSFGSTQLDMHDGDGEDPFADVEFAHPSDDRVDLKPAPLLLHEDPDHPDRPSTLHPPLMLVDLDSVRCPDCGRVHPEAHDIVDRFDAYTEVSTSGTGLHVWVRAELPPGLGQFLSPLGDASHPALGEDCELEMYDHGRFNGATWRHVQGTPRDRVPERTDVVEDVVDQYATAEDVDHVAETSLSDTTDTDSTNASSHTDTQTSGDTDNQSPYYGLGLGRVFDRCPYAYRQHTTTQRGWENGPHPVHGPDKSDVEDCTNFGTRDGHSWFCFWHGDKQSPQGTGGALALIAVNEGWLGCKDAYRVYDGPKLLAAACIAARDKYGYKPTNDNGDPALPPVKALYGLLVAAGRDDVREPERLMYTADTGETNQLARQVAEQMWAEVTLKQFEELIGL